MQQAETRHQQNGGIGEVHRENYPDLLHQAIALVQTFVQPWKQQPETLV